jgi:hypothetical protein
MAPRATHPPVHGSSSFDCPRCGVFTSHTWRDLLVKNDQDGTLVFFDSFGATPGLAFTFPFEWSASTCFACKASAVWRNSALVFPAESVAPVPHEEMPDAVRELYDEAAAVVGLSRRAGAALARAALERLLKSLDTEAPPRARLDDYIARVADRVTAPLSMMLTPVRHIGNKALHGADDTDEIIALYLGDVEEGLVEILFEAINGVVDELISRPRISRELYERLPKAVRDDAERKAANEKK